MGNFWYISNADSFEKCNYWISAIKEREPLAKLFLVGTKLDAERKVSQTEAENFAINNGMDFIETSSKTGKNVELLFKLVASSIVNSD